MGLQWERSARRRCPVRPLYDRSDDRYSLVTGLTLHRVDDFRDTVVWDVCLDLLRASPPRYFDDVTG
jgi:hypothetical protein